MARLTLTEIREAVVNALNADAALSAAGWMARPYDGEIEDYLSGEGGVSGVHRKAILFDWREGAPEETTTQSYAHRAEFTLVMLSNHQGGSAKRREELEAAYEMAHDALVGKRLGLDIQPISITGWERGMQERHLSAMEMHFKTVFDYNVEYER